MWRWSAGAAEDGEGEAGSAAQKQALERQRQAHLAWAGKSMVASSLGLMQEAVETIRAVFLLPQKDLKCVPLPTFSLPLFVCACACAILS